METLSRARKYPVEINNLFNTKIGIRLIFNSV